MIFHVRWLTEIYNMTKSYLSTISGTIIRIRSGCSETGQLTDNDSGFMNDREKEADFEINNMLITNHKLTQKAVGVFPILHRDTAPMILQVVRIASLISKS